MNKRKNTSHVTITLFPFLSVIACVIGTLTLLLAGLAVGEIPSGSIDNAEYDSILKASEEARGEIAELESLIADANAREDLMKKIHQLQEDLGVGSLDEDAAFALLERLAKLREEVRKTDDEISLQNRKKNQASLEVIPMGGGQGLIPAFVECTAAGLVLDADAPEALQRSITRSSIKTNKELVEYSQAVSVKTNWTVIFLIRQGGVKSYDLANQVINGQRTRHGCLAAPGTMKLNFEAYRMLKGGETGGKL